MLVFFLISTLLQIPLRKWASMDPLKIEDGPTWLKAAFSIWWPTLWFIIAFLLKGNGQEKYAAMAAAFAFGAAIGPCFLTFGNSSGVDLNDSHWLVQKYVRFWEGIADAGFKGVIVMIIALPLKWFFGFDTFYWVTAMLAFALLVKKSGVVIGVREMNATPTLLAARSQMLIGSNVLLTMIVGVVSLGLFLISVAPVINFFGPVLIDDYLTVIAFVLGIGLHFR